MGDSLRYTTVDSSRDVLRQLYTDTGEGDEQYFSCKVRTRVQRKDVAVDAEATLYVKRKLHDPHDRRGVNGEREYDTWARLTRDGRPFAVTLIVHSRTPECGATLVASPNIYEARDLHILRGLEEPQQ